MDTLEIIFFVLSFIFILVSTLLLTISLTRIAKSSFYISDENLRQAHRDGNIAMWVGFTIVVMMIIFMIWFFPRMTEELKMKRSWDWGIFIIILLGLIYGGLLNSMISEIRMSPNSNQIIGLGIIEPINVAIMLAMGFVLLLLFFITGYILKKMMPVTKTSHDTVAEVVAVDQSCYSV